MKNLMIVAMAVMFVVSAGCGSPSGLDYAGGEMGTVRVISGIGQGASAGLSKEVETADVDELLTRTYSVLLGDSADCANANFVVVFDESGDTSDCVFHPQDTSMFSDASETPEIGANETIPPDSYHCLKIVLCDQMAWSTSGLDECQGAQFSDIHDPRDEAGVIELYWSTEGGYTENELQGSAEYPFELTEAVDVSAGEVTNLIFNLSNGGDGFGMIARYDSENSDEFLCEVPAPSMTITAE